MKGIVDKIKKLKGIAFSVLSCLLYMCNNFMFKYSCNVLNYYPYDILLIRGIANIFLSMVGMHLQNESIFVLTKENYRFIVIRQFLIIPISIIFSLGVLYLPISIATVVYYTTPIITIFLASYSLNEKSSLYDIVAAFTSFIGLVIIVRPPFLFGSSEPHPASFYIAIFGFLVCSVSNAFTNIMNRKIKSNLNFFTLTYYYGMAFAAVNSIIIFIKPRDESYIADFNIFDFLFCVFIAVIQYAGSYFQYISFKYEEAGRVTVATYMQILFTYIVEILVFNQIPTVLTIIGATLIVGSCVALVVNKLINDRRKRSLSSGNQKEMEERLSIET